MFKNQLIKFKSKKKEKYWQIYTFVFYRNLIIFNWWVIKALIALTENLFLNYKTISLTNKFQWLGLLKLKNKIKIW